MRFALPQAHFLSTLLSPSANCQKARAAAIRARPCPPKTKALGRHAAGGRSYSKNALSGAGAAAEQSEEPVETHAATSRAAIFTGSYAFLGGVALVLAPNTVFGLVFDASTVPDAWIRVGGVILSTFGAQYLDTGLSDPQGTARAFYRSTVTSRIFLSLAFLALVLLQLAPPGLLLLSALNTLGALSMAWALFETNSSSNNSSSVFKDREQELANSINDCNPLGT